MSNQLIFFIITQLKPKRLQLAVINSGFTLIELLVAMVLAFLVITPLLGFMINVMDTDRKEQAKVNSEQEVQAALDYIAQDLQQAIYVYDAKGIQAIYRKDKTGLPYTDKTDRVPVLVFWKREFKNQAINVKVGSVDKGKNDSFVYSLVAYYLIKNDSQTIWSDQLRIGRFEIKDGVRDLDDPINADGTPKYVKDEDPDNGFKMFSLNNTSGTLEDKMNAWTKSSDAYTNDAVALVDYIDESLATTENKLERVGCTTVFQDRDNKDTPQAKKDALRVPAFKGDNNYAYFDNTDLNTGSFYACVDTDKNLVKVFIRGNALARIDKQNNTYNPNKTTYFPSATIQIQGKGLIGIK
ncbi:MAG: hormogonium polysaccharide secretion pseudopilin HpsC [Tolypothrix carrinoi HA7290-LM1]|jgi:type II secretory pathway pseudopilin PulG|nr:hormogonium polysaccharide secretion pseudopilin HpsC [Tolypothrix carrinoi HA7290-LM1]